MRSVVSQRPYQIAAAVALAVVLAAALFALALGTTVVRLVARQRG